MRERIELVKAEVVARGVSWREFEEDADEGTVVEDNEPGVVVGSSSSSSSRPLTNGVHMHGEAAPNNATTTTAAAPSSSSSSTSRNPWTDGTFQVGTIRNGELHMDAEPPQRNGGGARSVSTTSASASATATASSTQTGAAASGGGGRLTDEELRRLLEVRLAEDAGEDEDGGLHL